MGSRELGQKAEVRACRFLKRKGFKILERNYTRSSGEIDIIAREGDTLCFIEVKMRTSGDFGLPADAVTEKKQRKISLVAREYLASHHLEDSPVRFDVISIMPAKGDGEVLLIRDAFGC